MTAPIRGEAQVSCPGVSVIRTPARFSTAWVTSNSPSSADSHATSTRASARAPIHTVTVAMARKGQMRDRMARPLPPTAACQTLVTKDGTSNSTMAVVRSRAAVSRPQAHGGQAEAHQPLDAARDQEDGEDDGRGQGVGHAGATRHG